MEIKRSTGLDKRGGWSWNYKTMEQIEKEMEKIGDCNATLEDIDAILTVLDKAGVLVVSA